MARPNDPKKIEEWKDKLRQSQLGRKQSRETIEKRRMGMLGNKLSEQTKQKISEKQKGRVHQQHEGFQKGHTVFSGSEAGWFHTGDPRIKQGPESHHWKGGKSFEPYPPSFTRALKLQIRKRDDFTCQRCGISEPLSLLKYKRVLSVNHIDFNKNNCDESNLNALCCACNTAVNHDREASTALFREKQFI